MEPATSAQTRSPGSLRAIGVSRAFDGVLALEEVNLQQGIPIETARAIVKFVKELKIKKVQGEIQGEQVRVVSPSRDDLQTVMHRIKGEDFGIDLKFGNYRSN